MTMREEPTPAEGAGPAAHTEIELKLTGDPTALKKAFASPVLRRRSSGRARTALIRTSSAIVAQDVLPLGEHGHRSARLPVPPVREAEAFRG